MVSMTADSLFRSPDRSPIMLVREVAIRLKATTSSPVSPLASGPDPVVKVAGVDAFDSLGHFPYGPRRPAYRKTGNDGRRSNCRPANKSQCRIDRTNAVPERREAHPRQQQEPADEHNAPQPSA